jgi:hypothetical protein
LVNRILLIAFFFVQSSLVHGYGNFQYQNNDTLDVLISKFNRFLDQSEYVAAAKLFHYPPDYNLNELNKDINMVSASLELITNELGTINEYIRSDDVELYYDIAVGGGDLKYWEKHPHSVKISFEVEFEKEGTGYCFFNFFKSKDTWKIKKVTFALPASQKKSKDKIYSIILKLMKLLENE